MSDFDDLPDLDRFDAAEGSDGQAAPDPARPAAPALSKPERAAIILGVLGAEAASPILEQMDEACHRSFARAMARLRQIDPETVEAVVRDFVASLAASTMAVSGGLDRAREMLAGVTDDTVLADILDEADLPTARNVWEKLEKVENAALAEMLEKEHPQTAAVIVDRLPSDKAASILDHLSIDATCRIMLGMNRAAKLSPKVVEAIGQSVSRDFLAHQKRSKQATPADKIGAIMNSSSGEMRSDVLDFLDRTEPDLHSEVRKRMFTFDDIPDRVEKRDVTAIVRATPNEVLLPALAGAEENAPATRDYILANISSRVAEQIRDEVAELGPVKLRAAEEAQAQIVRIIRTLQAEGTVTLIDHDE